MTLATLFCMLSLILPAQAGGDTGELAEPYVDGSYGFSIRPPSGWQLIRQRVPERHGATLLQMVQSLGPARSHQIILKHTETTRAVPMNAVLREVADKLTLEFTQVEIHSQQEQEIAGRQGGYLSATMTRSGEATLRLQAVIEIAPRDYFVLIYTGPAELRQQSEPLFARVLASLTLLGDRLGPKLLDEALATGATWLASLQKAQLPKMPPSTRHFEVEMEGKPIGLVKVSQWPTRWKGRDGVRVSEEGWTFDPGGQVRRLQSRTFLSLDLVQERWQTSITLWQAAGKDAQEQFDNAFEEGLRDDEALLTSQADSLSQPAQQNQPIKVPGSYLSRALIKLLPRLVGRLDQPRRYGFTTFDHQRVGLVFRVMELKGAAALPTDAVVDVKAARDSKAESSTDQDPVQKLYRIDVREGLVTAPSTLYVDETGEILLMQAGKVTMRPADAKSLERLFADRVSEADRAMRRLEAAYEENESRFLRKPQPR